jgi:myo-inositol-1(or 4)-monophosphatase
VSTSASPDLHAFIRDLARRTGELQLKRYQDPGRVREKGPKDLVTEVDLLCEELLISEISRHCPQDAILSEERGGAISGSGRTWLLDPLDGTANYSRSNPLFCVCVSVVEDGRVTHAAVAAPRLGDVYHARLGGGAYRNDEPMRVSPTSRLEDAFLGADLSFFGKKGAKSLSYETPALQRLLGASWQIRALGSAGIRGAWLAAGYIDVSIGTRNTIWDYAPTALLVSEAGGRVTDLSGRHWSLEAETMLASNGRVHGELLKMLNPH